MYCGDEVGAVIGDVGCDTSKFGFAGEDMPKAVFPSSIGVVDEASSSDADRFVVGSPALNYRRDSMAVRNPINDGLVSDWEALEQLWTHGLEKIMRIDPKEHPLLLAEPSFNTQAIREKQAELAFEKLGVQALFIAKNALLSAFSVGRSTALVVDIGHGSASVAPVYDGHVLRSATFRSPNGGRVLTEYMSSLIEKEYSVEVLPRFSFSKKHDRDGNLKLTKLSLPLTHPSYYEYQKLEIVRDVKQSTCVAPEMTLNEQLAAKMPKVPYELPDGTKIAVGIERYRVPELLFEPSKFESKSTTAAGGQAVAQAPIGLHKLVHKSVVECDADIRKDMLQHILLVGGSSVYPNLPQRLNLELSKMVPSAYKVRCLATGPLERKFSVWLGGSILASLGSFQQLWLSKSEYLEHGARLIEQRFI